MSCFILCQDCGEIYDSTSGEMHLCNNGMTNSGHCYNCDQYGTTDMLYNTTEGTYYHRDLRECVRNLHEKSGQEKHRLFELEKRLSEFIDGRRAAVEATKEKMLQTDRQGENSVQIVNKRSASR